MPIADVIRLILYLDSRQAFLTKVVSFYEQPIRGSVCLCKPIQTGINRNKSLEPLKNSNTSRVPKLGQVL